ncbi:flagellar hook-length control protein flik, putative [Heliomicrobium modesticaldum Ice1]|uniref:Flagellar hook-length control protein flik, putative n=1 Tax=Heliobacterium modesticaldum (strain ATCC 51547 / Ice1) TaxID=498761 RepID=B0THA8_HELMI|nr:flagellar hook-length control protein FliK [Heliomicrobium modesticaldum]ABZ84783.1 flagellar hook-length control protein flik, putative [Heliomicrobium modesticaldum Ice1]
MADLSILNGLALLPASSHSAVGGIGGANSATQRDRGFSGCLHDRLCLFPQSQGNRMDQRAALSGSAPKIPDRQQEMQRARWAQRDSKALERSNERPRIGRNDRADEAIAHKAEPVADKTAPTSKRATQAKDPVRVEAASVERENQDDAAEAATAVEETPAAAIPLIAFVTQANPPEGGEPVSDGVELSAEAEMQDKPMTSSIAADEPRQPAGSNAKSDLTVESLPKAFASLLSTEIFEKTALPQGLSRQQSQLEAPHLPAAAVTEPKAMETQPVSIITVPKTTEIKTTFALFNVPPNQLALLAGLRKEPAESGQAMAVTTDSQQTGEPAQATASPVTAPAQGKGETSTGWMAGGQNLNATPGQPNVKGAPVMEETTFRLSEAQGVNSRTVTAAENVSALPKPAMSREAASVMRSDLFRQIVANSELLKKADTSELRIQLKPEFLGKLNLNLSVENGIVSVRFAAENLQVRQMLESNLNQLKQSLEEQGLRFDRVEVDVGRQGSDSHHGAGDSRQSSSARWESLGGGRTNEGTAFEDSSSIDFVATRAYYREDTTVEFLA